MTDGGVGNCNKEGSTDGSCSKLVNAVAIGECRFIIISIHKS